LAQIVWQQTRAPRFGFIVVNIRQLQYFLQVAELGSFTRAAGVLHVAQPALSRQIRSLEEQLGATLFNRSERGVSLTDAGRLLRDRAGELLNQLERLRDDVGAYAAAPRGEVSIGMPPSMREMLTVALIRESRLRFPHVVLHLHEGISMTLAEFARAGKLDWAVVSGTESMVLMENKPLLSEGLFLIGSPSSMSSGDRALPLKRVSDSTLILTSRPNSLRLIVEEALSKAHLPMDLVVDANSTAAMLDLVEAGVGSTVLPYCAAAERLQAGTVTGAPVRGLNVGWTVIHSRERGLSTAASVVQALLFELAQDRVTAGRWATAKLSGR